MKKIIFILFVLLVFSFIWADCRVALNSAYCQDVILECPLNAYYCSLNSQTSQCVSYYGEDCGAGRKWCYQQLLECGSENEKDSSVCVLNGGRWVDVGNGVKECKSNQCDSTMHCISYPYNYCEDVPSSGEITCINGNCYGLGGSKWVSFYDKNCTNECGATENTRVSGDTVYVPGGECTDSLQCSPQTKCADFSNGTYILYQNCLVGRQVVGNVDTRQTLAQITTSGTGSCKDNGYSSQTFPNSGGGNTGNPNHSQPDSINTDCLIYGVGCEPYQDSTNYSYGGNATPTKCWCEPFDGLNSVSYIKCPDGSSRVVYMSCDQWHNMFSSSSTTPPPSSGSGGGGVSSGSIGTSSSDTNPFQGKYPEYPSDQPTHNKNVQGALSGISDVIISIRDHLAQLKNYIMGYEAVEFDPVSTYPNGNYSHLDSVQTDLGFTFDSLFNRIDTSRKIIDTSRYISTGTCPIIKGEFSLCQKIPFFKGNKNVDMKFDFSDFFGFNLCSIIKAIILGFTSVVVFILSFRVISKSGM